MTLNQVIKRISQIAIAHKQVRNFYYGPVTEFLNDQTTRYASAFLEDTPGNLNIPGKAQSFGFRLYLIDLVHVSEDTKINEQGVLSDMLSVIKDLIAEINHSVYTDWRPGASNPVTMIREFDNDMAAGAVVDITIEVPYGLDTCAVPTEDLPVQSNPEDMKLVYDEKYVATGAEGTSLSVPAVVGKKVLFVSRENAVIYPVSNLPDPAEFVWDGTQFELGTATNPGDRFLILYRNY